MKLEIFISSAVNLEEKQCVKDRLEYMRKLQRIDFDKLYDCAEHGTPWAVDSKQDVINNKIPRVDWFICLIPEQTAGEKTWEELKLILEVHKKGTPVVISVFHPTDCPKTEEDKVPEGRVDFNYIKQQAKTILGNNEDQYWVSYEYGNKEDLQKQLEEEFVKLYHTDRAFRTQRLNGLAKLGCEIKAQELYFDKNRADIKNGFIEDKYFPRRSVDGKLQDAIMEQRKLIILCGAPGSGKTRALYQLMAPPPQWALVNHKQYALGALSNCNIIVVHRDNVSQVYQFLAGEAEYDCSKEALCEYYLVCDQLKDVFGMLSNEDLFKFFDMVMTFDHIHMIATSMPSAFDNFCERWKDYGRKPMEDEQLTKVIKIPQISSDKEEDVMRNWMKNELGGNSTAETIGDYIPQLNNYKQSIVKSLYAKTKGLQYLSHFLSALQITETFRYDTALFLPVLITRKNIYPRPDNEPNSWQEFRQEIAKILNFLIANNVIWVRSRKDHQAPMVIKELHEDDFSLEYGMDDDEDFIFDKELFEETPLSTSYTYSVNEIVWNQLEIDDANRRINQEGTLLKDFQNAKHVARAAKEFYRAFPSITTLRRILPRIPRTDCYDDASKRLWEFVYEELKNRTPQSIELELEEFQTTIGVLIGRSKDFSDVKKAIGIIDEKKIGPNYNIIGELYSAGQRLGKEKPEIESYVKDLRDTYQLDGDNFFSLGCKIDFFDMTFDEALDIITPKLQNSLTDEVKQDIDQFNLDRLLSRIARKGETQEQWNKLFEIHRQMHINLRRSTIHLYFSAVADQYKRLQQGRGDESPEKLMMESLRILIEDFDDIIANEDKESCYFYSIKASWNFKLAHSIYQRYVEKFKSDNPLLISFVLHTVLNHEFQKALKFLIEVDEKFRENGSGLSGICFNNLIKFAPNIGEALAVVPYMAHLQDHTLANILNTLKKKRRVEDKKSKTGQRQDPKIFYYAYSAVMREVFAELRTSPYIIGLLYDLATTPKHEIFIRDIVLQNIEENTKSELIDHSTKIASIRLQKNYRTLNEVWTIFKTCREHFLNKCLYINSELYNNMTRKLLFLCKNEELEQQLGKLNEIIKEDSDRIIRDEYFVSTLYRLSPEKQVIDDNSNISRDFIKEIKLSKISGIQPLNNIMATLKSKGFDIVWKFYEFVVNYYKENGRRKELRPDTHTITYLMETVTTREQLERVVETYKSWGLEILLKNKKVFCDIYATKARELGYNVQNADEKKNKVVITEKQTSPQPTKRDYTQRMNNIIERVEKNLCLGDSLTPTQFNQYLKKIGDIIKDINKDQNITEDKARTLKSNIYTTIKNNLIEKYPDCLSYDALSYVYLIQLSPSEDIGRWINELKKNEENYKYDMVVCAAVAQSIEVCNADIDIALQYFEYWENIVQDIGYDPANKNDSTSNTTEETQYNNMDDYDGYWLTRSTHCVREMIYYRNNLRKGVVNYKVLSFIKKQMEIFEQHKFPFPKLNGVDFKDELNKYNDVLISESK